MKNIIVAILTLIIVSLMAITASKGGAYHGGELGKVIKDIKSIEPTVQEVTSPQGTQEQADKEDKEKLQALRDKAGSIGSVKVSKNYKRACASCHGADGSGMQNGRKLMGPKLYGQSAEKLYKDLVDFKAGRKENLIMKGLLRNFNEKQLKEFADEIGGFASQKQD